MDAKINIIIILSLLSHGINGQFLPPGYQLNGAVSSYELSDSINFQEIYKDQNLLIKENSEAYYIGMQSDILSILNAYYLGQDQLKVMHVSAAMGEINYNRQNDEWIKDRDKWEWIFRDPEYWDELHPQGIQEFDKFYEEFGWVGTTISYGSYREIEMLISKEIVPEFDQLRVSYHIAGENESLLIIGPGSNKQLTGNAQTDLDIHNGYLPEKLEL